MDIDRDFIALMLTFEILCIIFKTRVCKSRWHRVTKNPFKLLLYQ